MSMGTRRTTAFLDWRTPRRIPGRPRARTIEKTEMASQAKGKTGQPPRSCGWWEFRSGLWSLSVCWTATQGWNQDLAVRSATSPRSNIGKPLSGSATCPDAVPPRRGSPSRRPPDRPWKMKPHCSVPGYWRAKGHMDRPFRKYPTASGPNSQIKI